MKSAVLWLSALAFMGFGLAFTFAPEQMAATVDIALPTGPARIDFVATYGGFELGFGFFLALCTRRRDWLDTGLVASACALGGFATLRAAGILLAETPGTLMYAVLAMETAGCMLSIWASKLPRAR
jgi:hypothetical protein